MVLQTSGPISLANIQTEFGGSNPISLSEYYAGGLYVPAGTTGTNGAVPSSGQISLSSFYGTSAVTISINNYSPFQNLGTHPVRSTYYVTSGGKISYSTEADGINPTDVETWCTPTSQAGNYEVKATVVSGSLSGDSTATWLATSTTRGWYIETAFSGDSKVTTFTVEIRRAGTTTVLDSATITLDVAAF